MKFSTTLLTLSLCVLAAAPILATKKRCKKTRWLRVALTDKKSPLAAYYGNNTIQKECSIIAKISEQDIKRERELFEECESRYWDEFFMTLFQIEQETHISQ